MKQDLLESLRCPGCREGLGLEDAKRAGDRIESGVLKCGRCDRSYPIIRFVPRFVPQENYAENFGFQWNRFRKTQLDSSTGIPVSRNRFVAYSEWSPEKLKGKRVLDVGCGAGRFTEIALDFGARVVAMDYSSAVDACRANFSDEERLEVVQGDIYHLPFEPGTFDYVFCFGVLQHTPDPTEAFKSLPPQLRDGGWLAIDVYPKLLRNLFWSKYYLRWWTARLRPERLLAMVRWMVKYMLPLSIAVGRIPLLGQQSRQTDRPGSHNARRHDQTPVRERNRSLQPNGQQNRHDILRPTQNQRSNRQNIEDPHAEKYRRRHLPEDKTPIASRECRFVGQRQGFFRLRISLIIAELSRSASPEAIDSVKTSKWTLDSGNSCPASPAHLRISATSLWCWRTLA